MLSFVMYDLYDRSLAVSNILSYELSKNTDAPCDGLRLSFTSKSSIDEIYRVEAFDEDEKIFSGYVDTQREQLNEDGYQSFIYARSSACVLVDNEAEPRSYKKPSVISLFLINAKELGFESRLPNLSCSADYIVGKGTSCYDAINNLVSGITGKSIVINPDNQLMLLDSKNVLNLNKYKIISEKRVINRGNPLSIIDYKISDDLLYSCHLKSRFVENKKIYRKRKMNISALPMWQQEYTLHNVIKRSCESYYSVEFVIDGCHNIPLDSAVDYDSRYLGELKDYYITACQLVCDSKGERTIIVANKKLDLEEISYVAE